MATSARKDAPAGLSGRRQEQAAQQFVLTARLPARPGEASVAALPAGLAGRQARRQQGEL